MTDPEKEKKMKVARFWWMSQPQSKKDPLIEKAYDEAHSTTESEKEEVRRFRASGGKL